MFSSKQSKAVLTLFVILFLFTFSQSVCAGPADMADAELSPSIARALKQMDQLLSFSGRNLFKDGEWKYSRRPRFHYFYRHSEYLRAVSGRADRLVQMLNRRIDEGAKRTADDRVVVYLVDPETWDARWPGLRGFAPDETNEIFVRMGDESAANTFIHELAHRLLAFYAVSKPIPLWLNEGFAVYTSDAMHQSGERVSDRYITTLLNDHANALIGLRELVSISEYPSEYLKVHLFYYESYKTLNLLTQIFGKSAMPDILEAFIFFGGLSLEQKFARIVEKTGASRVKSFEEFEARWTREMTKG